MISTGSKAHYDATL